jgi:hypothetical protein
VSEEGQVYRRSSEGSGSTYNVSEEDMDDDDELDLSQLHGFVIPSWDLDHVRVSEGRSVTAASAVVVEGEEDEEEEEEEVGEEEGEEGEDGELAALMWRKQYLQQQLRSRK